MTRTDEPADTRTDVVADQIRQGIVLGSYPPGTRLRLAGLAEELDVSRVPLREAFRELVAEGLVEVYPHRGAVVGPLREQEVEDCFRLLETFEVMVAERAVSSDHLGVTAAMRAELDRMDGLDPEVDRAEMLRAHRAFHFAAFDALGEGTMRRHVRMLWHTCERYINLANTGARNEEARQEHHQLVAAFAAGDAALAAAIARVHVRHAGDAALRRLSAETGTDR
ncbi:DNA-binding transcriptional regulator, GntR family [Actinopolyspora alba]|uniref:DNA-binding transcriptional regulator, GntR family n=1 Tax=Actinopolyspora alba TaxID=673379 RepID=A0A1I1U0N4_9ACTN|nr:GntR family transcriptional regulator [Actinopolyspora alba]SFD64235.1 DNA-binding transcriptional regulator, GntR family [Actinopolyspora alba]